MDLLPRKRLLIPSVSLWGGLNLVPRGCFTCSACHGGGGGRVVSIPVRTEGAAQYMCEKGFQ